MTALLAANNLYSLGVAFWCLLGGMMEISAPVSIKKVKLVDLSLID
jgi:hypothetical protein